MISRLPLLALPVLVLAGAGLAMPAPAAAQQAASPATPATPAQQQQAGQFVGGLADEAFGVLRNRSLARDQARSQFRTLLRQNFAVDETGLRLIRRHRQQLSPQQLQAYRQALPGFLVATYSDRLYDFANARVDVVRSVPRGNRGDVDVVTRILNPGQQQPIDAIWSVGQRQGRWQVLNLTVQGVNVALAQEADFNAIVQRQGFDALVNTLRQNQ